MSVIDIAYEKAIEVLRMNVTKSGFTASPEKVDNYYSVWSRDHAICALAAVLTDDKELIDTAKNGIRYLLRNQIDHGQVPSYIEVENRKKIYGGLGAITSIDSNMWIVIVAALLYKKTGDKRFINDTNMLRYTRFYRLFKAFDSNDCGLIEVPKAGDWADIMNRTYHVLYDECLYYESLKALKFLFKIGYEKNKDADIRKKVKKRINWISKRKPIVKRKINSSFWFTKENIEKIREEYMIFEKIEEKEYDFYQSHIMPFKHHWENRMDVFGNILAIVTNISDKKKTKKIIEYIISNKINDDLPIRCLYPPVYPKNIGWESIYKIKEQPHTYHNGGIWPMIGGFWIYCLMKNNRRRQAKKDLKNLAETLEKQEWKFNEYMHGKTLKPLGKNFQAWSAAGYIIAYLSTKKKFNLFDF
jgi:glycogen debranching enzyme